MKQIYTAIVSILFLGVATSISTAPIRETPDIPPERPGFPPEDINPGELPYCPSEDSFPLDEEGTPQCCIKPLSNVKACPGPIDPVCRNFPSCGSGNLDNYNLDSHRLDSSNMINHNRNRRIGQNNS